VLVVSDRKKVVVALTPGLVEHHLRRLPLPDLLPAGAGGFGGLLVGVALLQVVGVELKHVGGPGVDVIKLFFFVALAKFV